MTERTWTPRVIATGAAAVFVAAVNAPAQTCTVMGLATTGLIVHRVRHRGITRFTRTYIRPAEEALARAFPGVRISLRVSRDMGGLSKRLLREASPAEQAIRRWYGSRIEPVVTWPAVQATRARNRLIDPWAAPVIDYIRRPRKAHGPSIRLTIHDVYLTPEQRSNVAGIIGSKIPVNDAVAQWETVGRSYRVVWTLQRRAPRKVKLKAIAAAIDKAAEDEFVLGLGAGDQPVSVSLSLDSPHICVSARSLSGKSTLVGLIAAQALRRGAKVIVLDPKGSHPALYELPGVDYCLTAEQCHNALVEHSARAEEQNLLAFQEGLTEWQGQRTIVLAEELNILTPKLKTYWAATRGKGDPKPSPAIDGLRALSAAGRSAKYNLIVVAQYLTAHTAAGPESRENFGVRALARYSQNQWKTLCGNIPMPTPVNIPGRWYVVVDGDVTEVQAAYLSKGEIIQLATGSDRADQPCPRGQALNPDELTLIEAIDGGLIDGKLAAVQKRLQRSAARPAPISKRNGNTDVYRREELLAWAAANPGSTS